MVTVMAFIFFIQATHITGNSFYRIFPPKLKAIYSWEKQTREFPCLIKEFLPVKITSVAFCHSLMNKKEGALL